MKIFSIIGITLCVAACAASCSHSMESTDVTAPLDSLFEARYADPAAPGAAVIIAKGDSIIYERYFGMADIPAGAAVTDTTMFNIASVSKQFTAVALLQQPSVDIESPASDYFDYPQAFWHDVTLAHLASHASGIPDTRDRSDRMRCVLADEEQSISYLPSVDSTLYKPGDAYMYLNPSFILLSKVVEQASGEDFYDYMPKHIFEPLGMAHTMYFSPEGMPVNAAHGYVPGDDGQWQEYDYGEETFFATRPDGGIYSTARDMLKWEDGLASGKVLSDSLLRLAYTPRVDVASSQWCDYQRRPGTSYALGWFVEEKPGQPTKVYHTGDNGGFQAYVAKYPSEDVRIIVLENRNDNPRWAMAEAIDSILIKHKIL